MRRIRAAALLALCPFVLSDCASDSAERRLAFVDAGAAVRRRETGHTYEEARKDLALFVDRDIRRVRGKARDRIEKTIVRDRWAFAVGSGLTTLGLSAGSLEGPAGAVLAIVGAALASTAVGHYVTRVGDLKDCAAFLDRSERRLREFERRRLSGEGELPQGTWEDYVAETTEIQRFPGCLSVQ